MMDPQVLFTSSQYYWLQSVLNRRSTQLLLALEAWRLEHGAPPESLDELVGPYFAQLPRDPYSGRNFLYFPNGLPQWRELDYKSQRMIHPPVIWTCGPRLLLVFEREGDAYYQEIDWRQKLGERFGRFDAMMTFGKFIHIPQPLSADENSEKADADADASASPADEPASPQESSPAPPPPPEDQPVPPQDGPLGASLQ